MKTLLAIIAILLIAGCVWFVAESTKPNIVARIEFNRSTLFVTNGNDSDWKNALVILNDSFAGPRMRVKAIEAGERRALPLAEFRSDMNQQYFKPEFEKVSEVIIVADGFQLGVYNQ